MPATAVKEKSIFLHADFDSDSHLPNEVLSASEKTLGSVFKGRAPMSPLSDEEERNYLPAILGVSPNDPEWREEVKNYWANLSIDIGTGGVKLNITKRENGDPVNVEDWIRYKFAKAHEAVADNKEEAQSNPNKDFYLRDPDAVLEKENQRKKMKGQAWRHYLQHEEDEMWLDLIIRVMGNRNPKTVPRLEEKQNLVTDLVGERPGEFLNYATDENLRHRAFVQAAINNEIIRIVGEDYHYNDRVIGQSLDDVIAWLTSEENTRHLNEIKSKLENLEV